MMAIPLKSLIGRRLHWGLDGSERGPMHRAAGQVMFQHHGFTYRSRGVSLTAHELLHFLERDPSVLVGIHGLKHSCVDRLHFLQ
jgi:hypothetical protein